MPPLSPASTNSTFMLSVTPLFFPVKTDNIYILFCNHYGVFCFCPPGSSTEETHHRHILLLHEPDCTWGGGGSGSSPPPTPPPSPSPTLFSWPKPSLDTDYRPVLVGREVTVGMVTAHHACACLHHCRHRFLVPRSCVSFSHGTVSSLKVGPDFFLFVSPGSSTCLTHRDP